MQNAQSDADLIVADCRAAMLKSMQPMQWYEYAGPALLAAAFGAGVAVLVIAAIVRILRPGLAG